MKLRYLAALALALGLGLAPVHGYSSNSSCCNDNCCSICDCFSCCSCGLGTGFMVGANATFHSLHYHSASELRDGDERMAYEFDSAQCGEGGGIFVGYGFSMCQRFRLGLVWDGAWIGGESTLAYANGDIEEVLVHKVRTRDFYDLSIQPGTMIGDCLLLYWKGGISWAGTRSSVTTIEDDAPYEQVDHKSSTKYRTGYVLGTGARVNLCRCLSGYVEYNWRSYDSSTTHEVTFGGNEEATVRLTRVYSNAFTFGLMASF